jgi:ribokinase
MAKILVIGSLNMDLVIETPLIPVMGETILGSGFITAPGGKGANQAVAAAKLGGDVAMIGCIGNDIFGRDLLTNLTKNNVHVNGISMVDKIPTGVAVIVVKEGNNFIIVDPGANFMLTPEIIEQYEPFIQECSMLLLQFEIPVATVEKAIRIAKKHQVKVILNPAPAKKLSDEMLAMVDIITPNESECESITGLPVKNIDDAGEAILFLRKKGIPQVIITLGSQGVIFNNGDQIVHKPALEVQVVDTTAAGDSFTGALAVALSEGKDIDTAIDFSNIVGALTVTQKGAQTSLPTRDDINRFSLNQWPYK